MNKSSIAQSVLFSLVGMSLCINVATATELTPEEKKQEDEASLTGFGGGVIAGAAFGGPIGALIGGIVGTAIADNSNQENRNERLANKLEQSETQLLTLQQEYQDTLLALKTLEAKQGQVQVAALQRDMRPLDLNGNDAGNLMDVESSIQFKTDSYQLEQHYLEYLDAVAQQLKAQPDMVVQLFGYADRRGDENYNLSLSEKRAGQVKTYLVSIGVSEAQIETTGYGEAQPVAINQNHENDFFDRRVVLRIDGDTSVMTAKQ